MPDPNPKALEFLLTRRSVSHKTLKHPAPNRAELEPILIAGARVPDHKMLEPFRFIVLQDEALNRLGGAVEARAVALGMDAEQAAKARFSFENAPLSVAVVAAEREHDSVPRIEQSLTIGCACMNVLSATLASGWGANWITGWAAFDGPFLQQNLGLNAGEYVAGFIHIGTAPTAPSDRRRPDLSKITTWIDT